MVLLQTSAETNSNFYYSTSCELNDRMFDYSISMYFYAKTFVRVQITMLLSICLLQIFSSSMFAYQYAILLTISTCKVGLILLNKWLTNIRIVL